MARAHRADGFHRASALARRNATAARADTRGAGLPMKTPVESDPWALLRSFTPARIALGRAGESLPTAALLEFGLAHAQARDAVHRRLDLPAILEQLAAAGFATLTVDSAAND